MNTVKFPARCSGDAYHSLVALALTECSLVEAISPLFHGVGGDLAQGVHDVLLPMPHLWILHNEQHHPTFDIKETAKEDYAAGNQ